MQCLRPPQSSKLGLTKVAAAAAARRAQQVTVVALVGPHQPALVIDQLQPNQLVAGLGSTGGRRQRGLATGMGHMKRDECSARGRIHLMQQEITGKLTRPCCAVK